MTFEQFINSCMVRIGNKISNDKLYFQYNYYPDSSVVGNSYKCQVKGSNLKIYITPTEGVCQYYNKDNNFINLSSLSECLDKFIREL